jgi:histidine triad (HIT) family protein
MGVCSSFLRLRHLDPARAKWHRCRTQPKHMEQGMSQDGCIFCQIASGEIPAEKVYEDDKVFAINDIAPSAPVHILVIPHAHVPTLLDLPDDQFDLVGHVFKVARQIAREKGIAEQGFKLLHNVNDWGGQRVYHIHFHILGGKKYGK